eukprot:8459827-Alexandrium_andersonii.AAC.1
MSCPGVLARGALCGHRGFALVYAIPSCTPHHLRMRAHCQESPGLCVSWITSDSAQSWPCLLYTSDAADDM